MPEGQQEQELRLALVLNGGVSLAIWMGGVTVEINRLVNGDGVYGDTLKLMNSRVRVDVIAGASAGGINGAMLASMIAHQNSPEVELDSLREVWLKQGALGGLFRSPMQKDPPSLLMGDEYFLPRLRDVFERLTDGGSSNAEKFPIRLTLTTTLMKAASRGFADDFGSLIADADHRGEFTFRRGKGLADHFDKTKDPDIAKRLALASRCTASFPVAFEPSYVPVNPEPDQRKGDPHRPDMQGFVNFRTSRFCVDGGVLVNKPFRPAIRGIFAQPATEEDIRRVLAYIVPDPSPPGDDAAQPPDEVQTIAKVALASSVTLPRTESVSRELEDIADHNRRVQAQRLLRESLLAPVVEGVDVVALARQMFPAFVVIREQLIIDRLTTDADPYQLIALEAEQASQTQVAKAVDAQSKPRRLFDGVGKAQWNTDAIRDRIHQRSPWLPRGFPTADATVADSPWTWGTETIEAMGGVVLGLISRGLRLTRQGEPSRAAITEARSDVHDLLQTLRLSVLGVEPRFWADQTSALQAAWTNGSPSDLEGWELQSFEDWLREHSSELEAEGRGVRQPAAIALGIAGALAGAAGSLVDVARREPPATGSSTSAGLEALVRTLVPNGTSSGEAILHRLLCEVIVETVATAGKPQLEQLVELLEISSTAPNGFDPRELGSEKLAGRQLGHFGAFYKRSWRANDWMWGRLDGALRLSQMIVDPSRIAAAFSDRTPEERPKAALEGIEEIALGPDGSEAREVLSDLSPRGWDRNAALAELEFLAHPNARRPKVLPTCARAVARRIQLDILQEEIPVVADAVQWDFEDGAKSRTEARSFLEAVRRAEGKWGNSGGHRIGPKDVTALLYACRVSDEAISGESGSDLFTTTVTRAAAVGVTTMTGSRSGMPGPARAVMGSLRTVVLWLWILARNAVSPVPLRFRRPGKGQQRAGEARRSVRAPRPAGTGFAVVMFLFAAGGALLATSALGNVALPGVLAGVGTLILVAGVLLALLRAGGRWGSLLVTAVAAMIAVLLVVPSILVRHIGGAHPSGWEAWIRRGLPPVLAVLGLILGSMLLGLIHGRRPRVSWTAQPKKRSRGG